MLFYGLIILLAGVSLLSSVSAIAVWLHRRYRLPYALLTVGILTYTLALLVQFVVLRLFDRGLLGILPIGALAVGLVVGFTEEIARLLGYQYLARSAVTRPQALMIGLGHALPHAIYTGFLAFGLGLSLLGYGAERPDNLAAVLSGAVAEALNGLLPLVMSMALSWMVLQVFLRGELYWLFAAIFFHATAEIMTGLLGPSDVWTVVIWHALIAVISVAIIVRVRPPTASASG